MIVWSWCFFVVKVVRLSLWIIGVIFLNRLRVRCVCMFSRLGLIMFLVLSVFGVR